MIIVCGRFLVTSDVARFVSDLAARTLRDYKNNVDNTNNNIIINNDSMC